MTFIEWWQKLGIFHGRDTVSGLIEPMAFAALTWEAAQPKWRPIETAPKGVYSATCTDPGYVDPPKILLYAQEGIVIANWDYYYDSVIGGHGYDGNQTAWVTEEGELVEYQCGMPTHWMPLPQPPEGVKVTLEQNQTLREYDQQQKELEQQLKALLERRREYINRNQLNEKVGMK